MTLGVRAEKTLGPFLSILGLLFGPQLLINARTLTRILINAGTSAPRVANWVPKFLGILEPSLALAPIQGHKVQHLLVTWGRLKIF